MLNVDAENRLPERIRTHEMYVPERQTAEEMTVENLRRGLCPKSRGDWHVCEHCPGGCSYGRRLVQVMRGEAEAPKETPRHIPARTLEEPKRSTIAGKYSSEKRRAIAVDACRRVALGESWNQVGKEYGYTSTYLIRLARSYGLEIPETKHSNADRHAEKIKKHLKMLDAIIAGMDKAKAAKEVGGYASWQRARDYGVKHREEIAKLYHARKKEKQAVAD